MELDIIKVVDGGTFIAKERKSPYMTESARRFEALSTEINLCLSAVVYNVGGISSPVPSKLYVGRHEDKKWYRVVVGNTFKTRNGIKSSCTLIDYGKDGVMIPVCWLRECPKQFTAFPAQAKTYKLYGIQPVSMTSSPVDFTSSLQPCEEYDQHATIKVQDLLKNCVASAEIVPFNDDDVTYIRLYLEQENGYRFCLNEYLVERDMAIYNEHMKIKKEVTVKVVQEKAFCPKVKINHRRRTALNLDSGDQHLSFVQKSCNSSNVISDNHSHRCSEEHVKSNSLIAEVPQQTMHNKSDIIDLTQSLRNPFSDGEENRHLNLDSSQVPSCRTLPVGSPSIQDTSNVSKTPEHSVNPIGLSFLKRISPSLCFNPRMNFLMNSSLSTEQMPVSSSHSPAPKRQDCLGGTAKIINRCNSETSTCSIQAQMDSTTKSKWPAAGTTSEGFSSSNIHSISPEKVSLANVAGLQPLGALQNSVSDPSISTLQSRLPMHVHKNTMKSKLPKKINNDVDVIQRVQSSKYESSDDEDGFTPRSVISGGEEVLLKLAPNIYQKKYLKKLRHFQQSFVGNYTNREEDVVVFGESTPKPLTELENSPVPEAIRKELFDKGFQMPTKIQAYAWPAILRGCNVIGVAPSGCGKILAYLVPLLSQIIQKSLYEKLPEGNWPKAIILTPSHRSCYQIKDQIDMLIGGHQSAKAIVIHAIDCESSVAIQLLNGCDILIATPDCLLRMLKNEYTDLKRLCHIVLNDAHILTEEFTEQIREIMRLYILAVQDFETRPTPVQRLLFGSIWTRGMESFMEAYMNDPIIYMTSLFEASIYARVKPIEHMCPNDNLNRKILDVITSLDEKTKVITVCADHEKAVQIHQLLMAESRYSILCTHAMVLQNIQDAKKKWKQGNMSLSRPILVITDGCVSEVQLKSATCIVHCDLPDTSTGKTVFGRRLGMMSEYFKEPSKRAESLTHHIIITEKCFIQARSIVRYLKRVGIQASQNLKRFSDGILEGKEESAKYLQPLCQNLKSLGYCRDITSCSERHVVTASDNQFLPTSGEVKVLILNVINASQYYARLVEHRCADKLVHFSTEHLAVAMKIGHHYSKPGNCLLHSNPSNGDLCAVRDKYGIFHRAEIIEVIENLSGVVDRVGVFYVDDGNHNRVLLTNIFKLPSCLHTMRFQRQAVEIYVCRVKPVDNDVDWTVKVSTFVHELICGKELTGKIVLSIGNTLWLDPIVERSRLKTIKIISHNFDIRNELLINKFADDNPVHIKLLHALCENKIEIPDVDRQPTRLLGQTLRIGTEILPKSTKYHYVFISAVESPDKVFVQLVARFPLLEAMLEDINADNDLPEQIDKSLITTGMLCLAKYPLDKRWYRAEIKCRVDSSYEVFFIDFGDTEVIVYKDIIHLPTKYTVLPIQAIECHIANIMPKGCDWGEEVDEYIWQWSHSFEDGDTINIDLTAELLDESSHDSVCSRLHTYGIDLHTLPQGLSLSQELIKKEFALPSSGNISDLFPTWMLDLSKDNLKDAIPFYCAKLVREEESLSKLQSAMSIHSITNSENADVINEGNAVFYLSQTLLHISECDVIELLILSLNKLAVSSSSICEQIYLDGCVNVICQCLDKSKSDAVRMAIAETFNILIDVNALEFIKDEKCVIYSICNQLVTAKGERTVAMLLQTLLFLLKPSTELPIDKLRCAVGSMMKQLDKLSSLIMITTAPKVLMFCLSIMQVLIENSECTEAFIVKNGIKALCYVLKNTRHEQVIITTFDLLGLLKDRTKANRQVMFAVGLPEILKDLCGPSSFSRDVRMLGNKLWEDLDPSKSNVLTLFTSKRCEDPLKKSLCQDITDDGYKKEMAFKSVHPEVYWSQNKFRILLDIKIQDAKGPDIQIYDKKLHFSTTVNFVHYHLDLEFYDTLDEERCTSRVRGTVMVSLKKKAAKRWPFLLHKRHKPIFLHVDHERYVATSSESDGESSNGETPFILRSRGFGSCEIPWDRYEQQSSNMKTTIDATPDFLHNVDSAESSSSDGEFDFHENLDNDRTGDFLD